MNVIFLDPENSLKNPRLPPTAGVNHSGRRQEFHWDKECIDQLLRILRHTNARVVLTAKWRVRSTMRMKMNLWFKQNDLPPLLGVTPMLFGKGKAVEVLNWLDAFTDGNGPKGSTIHGCKRYPLALTETSTCFSHFQINPLFL